MKTRTYTVPVRSIVCADYITEATSKVEAAMKVDAEMRESMNRQLRGASVPNYLHPQIRNLRGYVETKRNKVKIIK